MGAGIPKNYDFEISQELAELSDSITCVKSLGVGSLVCCSSSDGYLRVYDRVGGSKKEKKEEEKEVKLDVDVQYEEIFKKDFHSPINHIEFLSDHVLLLCTNSGSIWGFNLEKLEIEKELRFHGSEAVLYIYKTKSNDVFVSIDFAGNIYFNSYYDGDILMKMKENFNNYYFPRIIMLKSIDDYFLVTTTDEYKIKVIFENKFVSSLNGHKSFVYSLNSFINQKKKEIIISGGADHCLKLWEFSDKGNYFKLLKNIELEQSKVIWDTRVLKNNFYLVVGYGDGGMDLYSLHPKTKKMGEKMADLKGLHKRAINSISWVIDDEKNDVLLVSGSSDCNVKLVKLKAIH